MASMRFRVQIYQRKRKTLDLGDVAEGILIGENEFLIGDMLTKRKQGLVQPLLNSVKPKV